MAFNILNHSAVPKHEILSDDEIEYKTASISEMQKSSLSDILNFELR